MIKKALPLIAILSLIISVCLSVTCNILNLQHNFFIWFFIVTFALLYCFIMFKSLKDEINEIENKNKHLTKSEIRLKKIKKLRLC